MQFPIEEFDAATLARIDAVIQKAKAEERERCARFVEAYYADDYEHFGPMKHEVAAALRALPLDES